MNDSDEFTLERVLKCYYSFEYNIMQFPCKNEPGIVEIFKEFFTKFYVKIDALTCLQTN